MLSMRCFKKIVEFKLTVIIIIIIIIIVIIIIVIIVIIRTPVYTMLRT